MPRVELIRWKWRRERQQNQRNERERRQLRQRVLPQTYESLRASGTVHVGRLSKIRARRCTGCPAKTLGFLPIVTIRPGP